LREVVTLADRIGLALTGAVARRRRAARLGGDEGRELRATSDAWMHSQRIAIRSASPRRAPFA
jgi:hypothetical protein